jgi:hypothetical protein
MPPFVATGAAALWVIAVTLVLALFFGWDISVG